MSIFRIFDIILFFIDKIGIFSILTFYNLIFFLLAIWFIIDLIRYYHYLRLLDKFNHDKILHNTNHSNLELFIKDMKSYPNLMKDNLIDGFYNKVKLKDMNIEDVGNLLFTLVNNDKQYEKKIKFIITDYKRRFNIFNGDIKKNHIKLKKNKIISIFNPLPLYLFTELHKYIIELYCNNLGLKSYKYDNGIKVWYNDYNKDKKEPLIFIHSLIGSISYYASLFDFFIKNHNIIIIDIPNVYESISINDITDTIFNFIDIYENDEYKYNLMGHSLGNNICVALINSKRNNDKFKNFFCVEGQIFCHRGLYIFSQIDNDTINNLLYKNLYVQYFIKRRISIDNCFLFENKNVSIKMYHSNNDKRIKIKDQLKYAKTKDIAIDYLLFNTNSNHGSFLFDNKIKISILDDLGNYY